MASSPATSAEYGYEVAWVHFQFNYRRPTPGEISMTAQLPSASFVMSHAQDQTCI